MTFLLRAALVIGALSYLALVRGGADPAAEARRLAGQAPGAQGQASGPMSGQIQGAVSAALAAIPPEARERAARDVLARGLMAELARRAGEPAAEPPSRDTLEEADRRPAWRGVEAR